MIRTAVACFAGLVILAAASLGAAHVARAGARAAAEVALRHDQLAAELARWEGAEAGGFAAAGTAAEARRTLELLQELYAQERRLWDYYDALEAQHDTRSELARERRELERRVARHEQRLEQLDASLDRLRPPAAQDDIRFSDTTN